jgi:hypothetical protein
MIVGKHDGPAYGLLSYGEDDNALLLRCEETAACISKAHIHSFFAEF